MWREGPDGASTLCNSCGVKFMRSRRSGQLPWLEAQLRLNAGFKAASSGGTLCRCVA